jgi:predicted DNA-binding transcriptional regulator AlpA
MATTRVPVERPYESHPLKVIPPRRLAELLNRHPATIWRWEKCGKLPPQCRFGGWPEDQIRDLLGKRVSS